MLTFMGWFCSLLIKSNQTSCTHYIYFDYFTCDTFFSISKNNDWVNRGGILLVLLISWKICNILGYITLLSGLLGSYLRHDHFVILSFPPCTIKYLSICACYRGKKWTDESVSCPAVQASQICANMWRGQESNNYEATALRATGCFLWERRASPSPSRCDMNRCGDDSR